MIKVLTQKFKNSKYAHLYLINIIEKERLPVHEALRETIKAMGLKSFSDKSGLSIQAVPDFVAEMSLRKKGVTGNTRLNM